MRYEPNGYFDTHAGKQHRIHTYAEKTAKGLKLCTCRLCTEARSIGRDIDPIQLRGILALERIADALVGTQVGNPLTTALVNVSPEEDAELDAAVSTLCERTDDMLGKASLDKASNDFWVVATEIHRRAMRRYFDQMSPSRAPIKVDGLESKANGTSAEQAER